MHNAHAKRDNIKKDLVSERRWVQTFIYILIALKKCKFIQTFNKQWIET